MIHALPGLALAAMLPGAGQVAPAARTYVAQVEQAVFATCPAVLHGDLKLDDGLAVAKSGLRRAPAALEAKLVHPTYGAPQMLGASTAGGTVSLSYYSSTTLCVVMFDGPQRGPALDRLRARVVRAALSPDPAQSGPQASLLAEAFLGPLIPGLNHRVTLLHGPNGVPAPANIAIIGYTKD